MNETPQLCALIVNWNGNAMLRDLLASIQATRGDLTVQTVVVDNASTDGSADMVAAEFPHVTILRNSKNIGFARGNNQAAAAANAPFLLLLNNDTLIRPGALQSLLQWMQAHPDAVAVGPKLVGADGKPQRSGRSLPTLASTLNSIHFLRWTGLFRAAYRRYRDNAFDANTEGPIGQLAAAALLVRRHAFQQCGGFDEGFQFGVEDVDLCRRLKDFGPICYFPAAEIQHLGRVSSRANRGFVYRGYECGWARYLRKHHGQAAALIYKTLVTADMPLRLILLTLQFPLQSLVHRRDKAARTRAILIAAAEFTFTGLPAFWRS